jgi:hypothetical protein
MSPIYRRLYRRFTRGSFRILGTACIFYRFVLIILSIPLVYADDGEYSGFAQAAKFIELRACVASAEVMDELFSECADPAVSASIRPSPRVNFDRPSGLKRFHNAPPKTPSPLGRLEPSPFPATSKVQPIHSKFIHQIQSTRQNLTENSTVEARQSSQLDRRSKSDSLSNLSDEVD